MPIFPLPPAGTVVRLINKFTDYGEIALMVMKNSGFLDPWGLAVNLYVYPLDRNDSSFNFTFIPGRTANTYWLQHVDSKRILSCDPMVPGGGYSYSSTGSDLTVVGAIDADKAQDNAMDWFFDDPNNDMLCHVGMGVPSVPGSPYFYLEATPLEVPQPTNTWANIFTWSQGGSSNQRWDIELV